MLPTDGCQCNGNVRIEKDIEEGVYQTIIGGDDCYKRFSCRFLVMSRRSYVPHTSRLRHVRMNIMLRGVDRLFDQTRRLMYMGEISSYATHQNGSNCGYSLSTPLWVERPSVCGGGVWIQRWDAYA